jgi:cellulose biosynthesis protein BcsQ
MGYRQRKFVRAKQLVFFNNKGGVGKTTLAYNTAIQFAKKGFRTVLVDLDPQCNLTRLALGYEYYENTLYSHIHKTIYDVLEGIIVGGSDVDYGTQFEPLGNVNENLFLLRGDTKLYKYENILPIAFNLAAGGNPSGFFQTSAIERFLRAKGMDDDVDIFVIDTSPSLNSLNQTIILGSDYFVVPLMPDAFSLQGIENMGEVFTEWKQKWKNTARAMSTGIETQYVLDGEGLFIGYIMNSFNVYAEHAIRDHQKWIEQVPEKVRDNLSQRHSKNGLVIDTCKEPLANLQDFGRLPGISQETGQAIFDIAESQVANYQQGSKDLIDKAGKEFDELSNKILDILDKY